MRIAGDYANGEFVHSILNSVGAAAASVRVRPAPPIKSDQLKTRGYRAGRNTARRRPRKAR
jgi:hypothetical protein